jgi:hypothetical protein
MNRIFLSLMLIASAKATWAGAPEDPASWTYQLISARGKARLVQRCRGPGACETAVFDARRRKLWSTGQAIAPRGGTVLSDDGLHVVHVWELIPVEGAADADAVALYLRGVPIRQWKLKDIVHDPDRLPTRGDTVRWVTDFRFQPEGRRFELLLISGERFSFPLASDEHAP